MDPQTPTNSMKHYQYDTMCRSSISPDSSPVSANSSYTYGYPTPLTLDWSPQPYKENAMDAPPTIPDNLTQELVDADPALKRFQQDLLVLTSFNDNSTLHWRPYWFPHGDYAAKLWTLHNPPDVVTELLPSPTNKPCDPRIYTRRMRRDDDPPPAFIKSWDEWSRVCASYGVPEDFLNPKMVELMRQGLKRSPNGKICAPPTHPLFPEPQPLGHGRYILRPESHKRLQSKFHAIDPHQVIVVHSNGEVKVEDFEPYYFHESQYTHFNGLGGYVDDRWYGANLDAPVKCQGRNRRWSYVPWTAEQEASCKGFVLDFRVRGRQGRKRKRGDEVDIGRAKKK